MLTTSNLDIDEIKSVTLFFALLTAKMRFVSLEIDYFIFVMVGS